MKEDEADVSIAGLGKAELLAELYNHARPVGLGRLQYEPAPMTIAEATEWLDRYRRKNGRFHEFDYLNGRSMKVNISGDTLETRLYDRDNGQGAAAAVVAMLRARSKLS